MFIIGIDPHKSSHTAAVIYRDERLVDQVLVRADRQQRERLLRFAAPFAPRLWAVEGATGVGALLAQQLVAAGEAVVDVPPADVSCGPGNAVITLTVSDPQAAIDSVSLVLLTLPPVA